MKTADHMDGWLKFCGICLNYIRMASTSGTKEIAKKLTKTQKRKLLSERGRKGAEKRGVGVGSRVNFHLPAKWKKTS